MCENAVNLLIILLIYLCIRLFNDNYIAAKLYANDETW